MSHSPNVSMISGVMRYTSRRILSKLSPAGICEGLSKRAQSSTVRSRSRFSGVAGAGAPERGHGFAAPRAYSSLESASRRSALSALAGSMYPGAMSAVKSVT